MHKSFKSSNFLNAIDKYAKKRRNKITDEIKEIEEIAAAKENEVMSV